MVMHAIRWPVGAVRGGHLEPAQEPPAIYPLSPRESRVLGWTDLNRPVPHLRRAASLNNVRATLDSNA